MQTRLNDRCFVWFFPGALSPPACFNSEFGCCWDYVTSALGPGGKGCPPCSDNRRYPNVCQRFRTYCRRKGISGTWMRGNCADACGHCGTFMVLENKIRRQLRKIRYNHRQAKNTRRILLRGKFVISIVKYT